MTANNKLELAGLNNQIIKTPTDIADKQQCEALVSQTLEAYGRIDCLINSAYNPGSFAPIESADLEGWQQAMNVNLFGTLQLTLACIPSMKEHGGGSVVMVNTMVTRKPLSFRARSIPNSR